MELILPYRPGDVLLAFLHPCRYILVALQSPLLTSPPFLSSLSRFTSPLPSFPQQSSSSVCKVEDPHRRSIYPPYHLRHR